MRIESITARELKMRLKAPFESRRIAESCCLSCIPMSAQAGLK